LEDSGLLDKEGHSRRGIYETDARDEDGQVVVVEGAVEADGESRREEQAAEWKEAR
jgi:hypothetical protein